MRNTDNKRKQTPSMYESLPISKSPMSDISSKTNNDNNISKNKPKTSSAAIAENNEEAESDGELPDFDNNDNSEQSIKLTVDHLDDRPPLISINSNDGDLNRHSGETSSKTIKISKANSTETRSEVWQYFTKEKEKNKFYDVCQVVKDGIKCSKRFAHHGSTTRMIDHLSIEHKLKQFMSKTPKPQKVITDLNKTFAKFIISSASSFRLIENEHLVDICNQYHIPIPNRKQLVDIINKMFDELNENMIFDLRDFEFLAGTTDGWTPKFINTSFISTTLHGLNENFEFSSFILGIFIIIPFRKSHSRARRIFFFFIIPLF